MKMQARVGGLASLREGLAQIAGTPALAEALEASAAEVRSAALAELTDGQSPESRTGELAASVEIWPAADGLSVTVGTSLDHGWHLEFGSRTRPARPWLQPALDAARPGLLARLVLSLRRTRDR